MDDPRATLDTFYWGWHNYQSLLVKALAPLSAEQVAIRPAPELRSLGETVRHILGARARWFNDLIGEGDPAFSAMATWDRRGMPDRSAAELVDALETTWRVMHAAIARWTAEEWAQTYEGDPGDEPATFNRRWIVWHLIEHDLHHGGEVSLLLGMHGLAAPDL